MRKDEEREAVIARLVALLKARRETLGLSLNETAWRAGLNHTMVLRVERRERTPTIETLLRMAEALEANLAQLLAEAMRHGKNASAPKAGIAKLPAKSGASPSHAQGGRPPAPSRRVAGT